MDRSHVKHDWEQVGFHPVITNVGCSYFEMRCRNCGSTGKRWGLQSNPVTPDVDYYEKDRIRRCGSSR